MKKIIYCLVLLFAIPLFSQRNLYKSEADSLWKIRHVDHNASKAMAAYKNIAYWTKELNDWISYIQSVHFYGTFALRDDEKKERIEAFSECIYIADQTLKQWPENLEVMLYQGLCYAERAKSDRSLSDARKARNVMEAVIKKDYSYSYGFPLTTLGKLYFEVPGWPIAFGRNKTALAYLRDAIKINPKNRYNYFFLTEVLWSEGHKKEARDFFEKGLKMPINQEYYKEDLKCLKKMEEQKEKYLEANL